MQTKYKIIKVKKVFLYNGIQLKIVDREEPFMNAKEPLIMTRVIAPNGGSIPLNLRSKQTLKSIIEDTIRALDGFASRGADNVKELTRELN